MKKIFLLASFFITIVCCQAQSKAEQRDEFQQKWFRKAYKNYEVNTSAIKDCTTELQDGQYLVFLGTWCSDSREQVPKFFKIADHLNLEISQVVFLDRERKSSEGLESKFNITHVPTFIMLDENGKEVGRIIETPTLSFESDLCKIASNR